jgi:serine/threonine protein kinase
MSITITKSGKAGEGTYGTVYTAKVTSDNPDLPSTIAIKRNYAELSASWIWSVRELDMLSRLKGHPFIVDLLDVSFGDPFAAECPMTPMNSLAKGMKEDKIHFVMECIPMSCERFLGDRRKCNPNAIKIILTQLLLGIEFMHSQGVVHRDLKPANLLLSHEPEEGLRLRLCDFGMSQTLTSAAPSTPGVTTSWYRAPEICCGLPNYGKGVDIWAVGCIAFELMTGTPYLCGAGDNNASAFNTIIARQPETIPMRTLELLLSKSKLTVGNIPIRRRSFLEQMNLSSNFIAEWNATQGTLDEFLKVLTGCLQLDPRDRLTATSALNLEFFAGMQPYIVACRARYPPIPPQLPSIVIRDCIERKWAVRVAHSLYNYRSKIAWYQHRVVFHALDIFDQYLNYAFRAELNTRPTETAAAGQLHTEVETELRFYVCLYLMHKYYSTIRFPVEWSTFAPPTFQRPELLVEAEQFELTMVTQVLQHRLYRDTVFEMPSHYAHPVNERTIRELLMEYGKIKAWDDGSARALYRRIKGIDKPHLGIAVPN